jgi:hypothetical protein
MDQVEIWDSHQLHVDNKIVVTKESELTSLKDCSNKITTIVIDKSFKGKLTKDMFDGTLVDTLIVHANMFISMNNLPATIKAFLINTNVPFLIRNALILIILEIDQPLIIWLFMMAV